MSSVAMSLATKGEKIHGSRIDPGSLNQWLTSNGGYADGDLIIWNAVAKLGKLHMIKIGSMSPSDSEFPAASAPASDAADTMNLRSQSGRAPLPPRDRQRARREPLGSCHGLRYGGLEQVLRQRPCLLRGLVREAFSCCLSSHSLTADVAATPTRA